jgi:hypothetical protein
MPGSRNLSEWTVGCDWFGRRSLLGNFIDEIIKFINIDDLRGRILLQIENGLRAAESGVKIIVQKVKNKNDVRDESGEQENLRIRSDFFYGNLH